MEGSRINSFMWIAGKMKCPVLRDMSIRYQNVFLAVASVI